MRVNTIYIETTNLCNLNCKTCYNRSGVNKEQKEVSKKQIEDIMNLFIPLGLNSLLISGGEPTLHTEFDAILDLVDMYPNIMFGVATNGTNINKKLIKLINTRDNLTVQISLDGSNEEQNSKTRGTGNFNKAIEFCKKIHSPKRKPLLKMVISQSNYDDIENFYKLALSLNCIPEFAIIYKSGNGSENWEDKTISQQQKVKALNLIDNLNIEYSTKAFLPLCTSKCPFVEGVEQLSICVKVDGSIQPCQILYSEKYTIGNAFNFDINTFNSKLNNIMMLAQKRYISNYDCEKCLINSSCGKGCMGAAEILYGSPLDNDGDCDFRKLQFIGHTIKASINK